MSGLDNSTVAVFRTPPTRCSVILRPMLRAQAMHPSLLLVRAAHPRQALVTAATLGVAAAIAGRPLR